MSFQVAKGNWNLFQRGKKGGGSKFFIKSGWKHTISSLLDISHSHPLRAQLKHTCLKEKDEEEKK